MGRQGLAIEAGMRNVIAAIVLQATKDYRTPLVVSGYRGQDKNMEREKIKKNALNFLKSEDCKYMCDVIELDHSRLLRGVGLEV